MNWKRWNNKTRRMFILIVSLLFVLQTATTFGLAKANDGSEDGDSSPVNELPTLFSDLMNIIDDSQNSTDDGTTYNGNEGEETSTTDSISSFEQNDGSDSFVAEQNPEPEIPLVNEKTKYSEAVSGYQTQETIYIECPATAIAGEEFKITVLSNDEPADIEVCFMGDYYLINENGEASITAPEIAEGTNLPVTVESGEKSYSYTKLIYIESGGESDDGEASNPQTQFQLLLQEIMWFNKNQYLSNFFFSNSEN